VPKGGSQCFVQEEGAHAAPLITARKHVYFVAHSWNVLLLLFGAAPGSFFSTWWRVDLRLRLFLNEVLQRFWSNESRVRPSVLRVWVSVVCSYCSLGFHLAHVP